MTKTAIVAGTFFANSDGTARHEIIRKHCQEGREVVLRREPDNPNDPNAIGVFLKIPGLFGAKLRQIGFIKAGTAAHLAKRIDAGEKVTASVKSFWAPAENEAPRVTIEFGA